MSAHPLVRKSLPFKNFTSRLDLNRQFSLFIGRIDVIGECLVFQV